MLAKPVPARLLPDEALDLATGLFIQDNIFKLVRRAAQLDQVGKVTTRSGERYGHRLPLTSVGTRLLDGLPNPFGHGPMSLPCLGGGYLQRDGEELFIVTGGSTAQHREDLSGIGHGVGSTLNLSTALPDKIPTDGRGDNAGCGARPLRDGSTKPRFDRCPSGYRFHARIARSLCRALAETQPARREAGIQRLSGLAPCGQDAVAEALQHGSNGVDAVFIQSVSEE